MWAETRILVALLTGIMGSRCRRDLDECEVELVVEVLEGLVKGEGGIVVGEDEIFK